MVYTLLQAHIYTIETMVKSLKALTTEVQDEQKKLEMTENSFHVAPVRTRASEVRARHFPIRESRQTPRTELWYFDCGEDMRRWDKKPTHVLATQAQELKDREKGKPMRGLHNPYYHPKVYSFYIALSPTAMIVLKQYAVQPVVLIALKKVQKHSIYSTTITERGKTTSLNEEHIAGLSSVSVPTVSLILQSLFSSVWPVLVDRVIPSQTKEFALSFIE
ncbi:hypothetical protein BTVI_49123 [Pitangus sulphuratus]|nr:hypothetical protein BTVI_49123 [Pitangus sulphuratus]